MIEKPNTDPLITDPPIIDPPVTEYRPTDYPITDPPISIMKIFFPLFSLVLAVFISCKNKDENRNPVFRIDVESRKSTDLKLSDLIDSCWFVSLETTPESVLGNNFEHVFIDEDFLIIDDGGGIYKFAADGRFIKKIINLGRGPDDLSQARMLRYDQKGNLLFIDDYFKDKKLLLVYDVISESFRMPVKKCFSERWGNFIIYDDSLIMGSLSPITFPSDSNAIFIQDFHGNYISGFSSNRKFIHLNKNEAWQKMLIYTGDKSVHSNTSSMIQFLASITISFHHI